MADFLEQLHAAVAGLTYPSESDEPFEVVTYPATLPSPRAIMQAVAPSSAVSEQPLAKFFDDLSDDPQMVKFRSLRKLIEDNLADVSVFRADRGSEIDIYLLGRLAGCDWAGLKTLSVET
jgi:hypothetical protein